MKKLVAIITVLLLASSSASAEMSENTKACLINGVTGEVVYEKNAYEKSPMASTTKIMTALVALENSNPYDVVTMTGDAVRTAGSSTYAKEGDKLYMEDVLYGLMLNSGNDAAEAVAQSVSGTDTEFAKLMTERAKECGAAATCFTNPSGLPDDGHYTTAYDMALIAKTALENEKFAEIVSTRKHKVNVLNDSERTLEFYNHNKLLNLMDDCTGVKTGYTKKAGRCLVSSAVRDGMKYIAVTLNDGDDWNNHIKMYEDVFASSEPLKILEKGECIKTYGKHIFAADEYFIVASLSDKKDDFDVEVNIPDLCPPINSGEKVGYARIMYKGNEIGRVDIVSQSDIFKTERLGRSFAVCFRKCIKKLTF